MKERDYSIDILKFLAALLITNSHMDLLYGKYAFLSTGGSIGDALFFFISGFTLFLTPTGGIRQFPNWYKKRIYRIYPTVLAVAIISCLFFDSQRDIIEIITHGGGWFISCIMIFYIFLYLLEGNGAKKFRLAAMVSCAALTGLFFMTDIGRNICMTESISLYDSHNGIRWLVYFNFMLFGAHASTIKDELNHHWYDAILLFASIVVFYICFITGMRIQTVAFLQYISIAPMLCILFYAYKVFSTERIKNIMSNRYFRGTIQFIGGLCLEIYLVQFYLFTDKMNNIFPLNILIMFIIIFVVAYMTRCLARTILQTFNEQPYDWKKVIAI